MTRDNQIQELFEKRKNYSSGSIVINCIVHSNMPITSRPDNCPLCRTDVSNTLSRAINVNKFLNSIVDDLEKLL